MTSMTAIAPAMLPNAASALRRSMRIPAGLSAGRPKAMPGATISETDFSSIFSLYSDEPHPPALRGEWLDMKTAVRFCTEDAIRDGTRSAVPH